MRAKTEVELDSWYLRGERFHLRHQSLWLSFRRAFSVQNQPKSDMSVAPFSTPAQLLFGFKVGSHLLSTKDETLLCWWDALLLLDSLLDSLDLVRLLNVELDLYSTSAMRRHRWITPDIKGQCRCRAAMVARRNRRTLARQCLDFDQHFESVTWACVV